MMYVYAGIDEAGYGPMFGPLLVGRFVLTVENLDPWSQAPDLWEHLRAAVCREPGKSRGRVAVNDSKKLYSRATGLKRLEEGTLAFAGLGGLEPASVDGWLDGIGETRHRDDLASMPWYAPSDEHPWQPLPSACTEGQIAVARSMLKTAAKAARVSVADLGAAVVFEDHFNEMVSRTRSKAAANFTFVGKHLEAIWQRFGDHHPTVVVDRQSGRRNYRELLSFMFPSAAMTIKDETETSSVYRIDGGKRCMTVHFEVEAEQRHMPVALASMLAKYTRELLMARFQDWFRSRAPDIKPTAGYALDAKRFWHQIEPMLGELAIKPDSLKRRR